MEQTADISSVRRTNYLSVTGYVRKHGSCPIPHIAQELGLSLPTVTRAVNFALECGVFIPDGMCALSAEEEELSHILLIRILSIALCCIFFPIPCTVIYTILNLTAYPRIYAGF